MNAELKAFLIELRQHPHFQQFMAVMPRPQMPEFRPSKGEPLEVYGARAAYASGQLDQYRNWHLLLTGEVPSGETNPSDRGDKT